MTLRLAALAGLLAAPMDVPPSLGETVHAAVAANFTAVAERLASDFEAATGHEAVLSFGATGTLYTQITQGAPFDVFFAADDRRTALAIAEGFGVQDSEFTYALGRLVLYSPLLDVTDGAGVLVEGAFHHIAVADPETAPYGAAALAVLDNLGLRDAMAEKIVTGENVSQTLQFVESGSAELGFVAMGQVSGKPPAQVWEVPQADYPPIRQNAVLLKSGADNEAARAFLAYVQSAPAIAIIKAAGYALE